MCRPVDHHVLWDAELTVAAAQVVASILEWPDHGKQEAVAETLDAITHFFEVKYALRPGATAAKDLASFRTAREKVAADELPRIKAAKQLLVEYDTQFHLVGDPAADWMRARWMIERIPKLKDVYSNVRFVRLFRATDEIGGGLAQQWAETGTYGRARDTVRRTLDLGRLMTDQSDPRGVVLMTMHKSKGKEFDAVVLVEGQHKGKFFDDRKEEPPFEATRRLLRVGITRARHRVLIARPYGAHPLVD